MEHRQIQSALAFESVIEGVGHHCHTAYSTEIRIGVEAIDEHLERIIANASQIIPAQKLAEEHAFDLTP